MKDEFKGLSPDAIMDKLKVILSDIKPDIEKLQKLNELICEFEYPTPPGNGSFHNYSNEQQEAYRTGNTVADLLRIQEKKIERKLEIEKKFEIAKQPKSKQVFKLSEKKGAKTNIIRILNAFYELRLVENEKGELPSKIDFMNAMGSCFGIDLSNYASSLSQCLQNQSLEINLEVFEEMKNIIIKAHHTQKK